MGNKNKGDAKDRSTTVILLKFVRPETVVRAYQRLR